ncbi:MAG: prepilin peptidase [Candidatus Pacebacteria bacterium]|nr:prepilin peptidase [Candidatus Paceibacterota bacterium]
MVYTGIYFIIFILGTCIGSLLNCIIYRLEQGKGFVSGRSYCPQCKHQLMWKDLIPILSFLILKGKCRYCEKKISLQYPVVELAIGLLFLLIFIISFGGPAVGWQFFQTILNFIFLSTITSFLAIIFIYDLKHYLISDKIVYSAIGITFLYQLFKVFSFGNLDFRILINPIISGILASAFFLAIVLISHGKWMGLGDVKLAFLMGLLLGFPNIIIAMFLSFFIGAIIGIGLIAFKKKNFKSEVPFGPFLVFGTFLAMFWGEQIINWYLNLFNVF